MADRPQGPSDADRRDRREALRITLGIAAILAVVALAAVLLWPEIAAFSATHLAPGLGLRPAVLWGFGVTFAIFVVFAVVSGDGVVGELPVMLGAFLVFWLVFSLSIAWLF